MKTPNKAGLGSMFLSFSIIPVRFYLPRGITNHYPSILGSLEWPFSELFFSVALSRNQYQFNVFNILSCRVLTTSCKILIIAVISNKTINELTI